MNKQLSLLLSVFVLTLSKMIGQCYTLPNYCIPTFANVNSFSIGLQNVSIGTFNNSSVATGNAPNYFDYTSISTAGVAGGTLSVSVKNGASNSTEARIYIDYNNDGTFSTSSPELAWTSTNTGSGQTVTGTITIPIGTAAGIYRIRVTGDLAGQTINPCALQYGEAEDYTLVVTGSANDAVSLSHTSPTYFVSGNNTIGFSFANLTSSNLSSVDIGYKLDNNSPVTQSLTGLSVAPGAIYTTTFSTPLNISSTGNYKLKVWVNNVNSGGTQTPQNDTICRNITVYCGSALSGTYTINPSGSGSTNFKSFGAVDTALRACGISGPVTFIASNGTYNYQLELGTISGISSSNTITFTGAGSPTDCILTATTSGLNPYIVRINGSSYIRFRNMTIRSTGSTDAWVVHIMNGNNNSFRNCIIEITGSGASNTNSTLIPIVINGSTTTLSTTTSTATNNIFDSCTVNAGYYGLYCSSSNGSNTVFISNSKLNSQYYYGLYFNSSIVAKINNNEINMRTNNTNSSAIYLINCNASGSNFHEINGNKIINAGQYGIQMLTSSGSGSAYGQIYNNMIGGGFRNTSTIYGISDNSSRYQIYHNSINMDFNASVAYCINLTGGSLHDIKNNHLVIGASAVPVAYPLNSTASSYISLLDNNNYYTNSGFVLVSIGSGQYTASNFQTAFPNGGGTGSISLNPFYTSNTNLHTSNPCNNGANLSLSVDFDGQSRANPPDIGADELTSGPSNDMGVMKINSPGFPLNTGSQSINVTLKNYGSNNITSADINYMVNGGTPVTQSWTGNLAPCDTVNFVFSTTYTFSSGANNLTVYTSSPNSTTDGLAVNDSSKFSLCPALSGTYTIGGSGANYSNFSAAVSDMICAGVKGPVVFNVAAGTYNEQINIPTIRGVSANNSITFKSANGNPTSVKLTYASTLAASNYTMRIFANPYVKVKDMTIAATGGTYGTALLLSGNTSYDSFTNVIFDGVTTTTNNTNHAVIALTSGSISNFITFTSCKVNNGAYGTYFQSNSSLPSSENLTFVACNFTNQYSYGMYNQYLTGLILKNNTISTNSVLASYNGMYNYWIMIPNDINRPIITGNRISGAVSGNGMYNYYIGVNSTVTTARRALVANNMIQIGSNASSTYGLRDNMGNGVDYIHNSVNTGNTQTTSASAAAFFEGTSYGSNVILNNVFSNYGGGAAIRINNLTFYPTCNYNNLYTSGATLGYQNTTARNNLANWSSSTSRDANSVSANPVFTSNTDLHSNQAAMDNSGLASSLVTTDIDNNPRCPNGSCPGSTANPDMGADEFQTIALDASINGISNATACSGSSASVQVNLKNIGTNTLTTATIEWSVDGTPQTPFNWTGSLIQGDVATNITIGSYAFSNPSTSIKVWTSAPNGGTDGNASNDTMVSIPKLQLNGTYTIGGTTPNFTNFTNAVAYITANGICGPVTFNVRQGQYNERIQINAITGSSAANFITFKADPNNTSAAEITINNNSTANDNHTIFLNGSSFIAFKDLSITNASPGNGTYGTVIRFAGTQDSIIFSNNIITGPITTNTSTNFAVINHGTGSANMINRFILDGNDILNGSYGLYLYGNTVSTTFESKNKILNNNFKNAYYTGIYSQFQTEIHMLNNKVILSSTSQTGSRGIYAVSNDLFRIERNLINNFGQYGLYLQNANNQNGTGTTKATVVNNMIGGFTTGNSAYGIYFGSSTPTSRHINIYHNSVSLNSTATGAALFFQNTNNYVSDLDIRNNSFANFGTGTYVCYFYFSGTYPVANLTINYNNYYTVNTNNLMFAIGTTGYTIATGGSPTYNANSRSGNPNYRNNLTDLHSRPTSTQLNDMGTNLGSVTTDYDNNTRPMSPSTIVDIGADEYNYVPSIGVTVILQPTLPVSIGTQNVVLQIQNFSTTTVNNFQVKYKAGINGTVRSYNWSGSLAGNSNTTHTFTGSDAYNYTGNYDTIYAWTDNPNGLPDAYNDDDTAKLYICRALNGNYTIDPGQSTSNTNFNTFGEAINALNNCGILGNVVINVASGTYTGQHTVFSIPGASANRTVTIQAASGNANDVILSFNANVSNNFTLRLFNTSFITFKNMTINANNTTYGTALTFVNARSNQFRNVIFNGIPTTSTANSLAVISSPSGIASFNYFDSCTVNNGSMGTYFVSNSVAPATENLRFNRCVFNNQYAYGMYNQYQIGLILTNNTITTNSVYNSYTGMYNYWVLIPADINRPMVTGNKIYGGAAGNGIYNFYFGVNSTITAERRSLVANNMVQIGNNGNSAYGIRDNNGNGVDYIHNSVNIGSTTTSNASAAGYFEGTSYGSNAIINNIFANEGGGAAIRINNVSYYSSCNYNNYYTTGSPIGYLNGTATNSFNDWKTTTGLDANSMNFAPMFNSSTDLHTSQFEFDNKAFIFNGVISDIDGEGRCPQGGNCAYGITRPDIGADEFNRTPPVVFADFNPVAGTVCDGDAYSFTNNSTVTYGTLEYIWDFGDGSSSSPAPDPSHIFPGPGTYQVKLSIKSSLYGAEDDTTISVTVYENPVAAFKNTNQCEGVALTFQNNSSINSGSLSFLWEFGDGNTSSSTNPTHTYANAGQYNVKLTATTANTGCKSVFTKNVYQFPKPNADFVVPQGGVCSNVEASISNTSTIASGKQGAWWSFGDNSNSSNFQGNHTYTSSGTFTIKLLAVSEFNCKDSTEKQITVKETPKPSFIANQYCAKKQTIFTNTSIEAFPGPVYQWTFSDNTSFGTKDVTKSWLKEDHYTVTLKTSYANGCSASITEEIEILPQPKAEFEVQDICSGEMANLVNKTFDSRNDIQFFWDFSIGTSTDRNPQVRFEPSVTTTYTIILAASYPNACSDTAYRSFTVNENPVCDFTYQNLGKLQYSFTPANSSYVKYYWQFGNGDVSNSTQATYTYNKKSKYNVTLEAENDKGCKCNKTITIQLTTDLQSVNDMPELSIVPNPNTGLFQVSNSEGKSMKIDVMDITGKVIKTIDASEAEATIDMQDAAAGVYFVKVTIDGVSTTTKIVINK